MPTIVLDVSMHRLSSSMSVENESPSKARLSANVKGKSAMNLFSMNVDFVVYKAIDL
jgi:hypothetical protein